MQRSVRVMLVTAGFLAGFAALGPGSLGRPGTAAAAQPGDNPPSVIAARLGIHPDKTRFVLEVSQRIGFRATVQSDPYRVVVELPELSWPGDDTPKRGQGIIRSYHVERPQPGSVLLVLAVAGPVRLGTAMLMEPSEGHQSRLVLDVASTTADAFQTEKDQARGTRPAPREPVPQVAAVQPPAAAPAPPQQAAASVTAPPMAVPARTPPVSLIKATPAVVAPAVVAPPVPPPAVPPAVAAAPAPPALPARTTTAPPPRPVASGPPLSLKPTAIPSQPPAVATPAVMITRAAPRPDPAPVNDGAVTVAPTQIQAPTQTQAQATQQPPAVQLAAAVTPPPPPPAAKPRRAPPLKPMIALDPGHGGVDPGATGINGIHEKDITLATAREVKRQLEATGRFRVIMTRDDDEFVPLRERVARARQAGADLFVSLHADSIARTEIRGLSIYTQSDKGSDHEAETLAAKENRADAIGGIDLSHENDQVATILIDLAQRDTRNHSRRFATTLLREAAHVIRLLPQPDRAAAFAVLTAPDVPSVLIEMGYLSNTEDSALLTQPQHRQRLAGSLVHAVEGYFSWLSGGRRS